MNQQIEQYWIFIASPSELSEEREAFRKIVEQSNRACAAKNVRFELLAWEDKLPAFGRPQEIINLDVDQADLFVGCLWRTIGSPSGDGTKTGFEEEFYRALARREKTGKPEIALFFKVGDRGLVADPGSELRKVLDFRAKHEKQLFFKEFETRSDWEQNITDLLWTKSLELAAPRIDTNIVHSASSGQSQAETTARKDEAAAGVAPAASPAVTGLARLLNDTGRRLAEAGEFEITKTGDAAACVRLMLFSATNYDWNVQHVRLGTHETNSVYAHRKDLNLTAHERLFLFRTILLDPFSSSPGWFWISARLSTSWLVFLASNDSDPVMRETAVRFAENVKIPFHRGKTPKTITRILEDDAIPVRAGGLHFLGVNGTDQDLHHINPFLVDQAIEVRQQANRAAWKIRMRSDADAEMRKTLERNDAFDDEMLGVFNEHVGALKDETLTIVCGTSLGPLRTRAAKELLLRGAISPELAMKFCQDVSKKLREYGFAALVHAGKHVDLAEVRKALAPDLFGLSRESDKPNVNHVVAAVFEHLSKPELWRHVEAFDGDSTIALSELGRRLSGVEFRSAILEDLENRFERSAARDREARKSALPTFPWPSQSDQTESMRAKMVAATLEVLANEPIIEDRVFFLRFLSTDIGEYRSTLACLRGLAALGMKEDREKISECLSSPVGHIEAAATRAYINTFPDIFTATPELCSKPSAVKSWVMVSTALHARDKSIWPALKPLLTNENEDIRRVVCFYATRTLTQKQLATLLDEYLNQYHYYNVVAALDRVLYAPTRIKKYFEDEERAYLKKWSAFYHPITGAGTIGEPARLSRELPPGLFP